MYGDQSRGHAERPANRMFHPWIIRWVRTLVSGIDCRAATLQKRTRIPVNQTDWRPEWAATISPRSDLAGADRRSTHLFGRPRGAGMQRAIGRSRGAGGRRAARRLEPVAGAIHGFGPKVP